VVHAVKATLYGFWREYMQRLGVIDREIVELINESPYLQYFIGMSGYHYMSPFTLRIIVQFSKRIGADLLKVCNQFAIAN
jgi:hypothetical protein